MHSSASILSWHAMEPQPRPSLILGHPTFKRMSLLPNGGQTPQGNMSVEGNRSSENVGIALTGNERPPCHQPVRV